MMVEYKIPTAIAALFFDDPAKGRSEAIKWLDTLKINPGDKVWMPHGTNAGELVQWIKQTEH